MSNKKTCPYCGYELPSDARACSNCGRILPAGEEQEKKSENLLSDPWGGLGESMDSSTSTDSSSDSVNHTDEDAGSSEGQNTDSPRQDSWQNQNDGYDRQQSGSQNWNVPYGQQNDGYGQQGGWQNQNGGYSQQNGGYGQQNSGYGQQGGWQNQNGGYSQQNGGYGQQDSGYGQQGGWQNQNGGYWENNWQNQNPYNPTQPGKSGLATFSFVMAIIAIFVNLYTVGIPSLIAMITGIVVLATTRKQTNPVENRWMAVAGLVIGAVLFVGYVVIIVVGISMLSSNPELLEEIEKQIDELSGMVVHR